MILSFRRTDVYDKGLKQLALALKEIKSLSSLTLNLR